MQLIHKIKLILTFALLCSTVPIFSQRFQQQDQNKVRAIEQLWLTKGIGTTINKWHGESAPKKEVAEQFKWRSIGQILSDKKEFARFFSDSSVSAQNLEAPLEWLTKKEKFYQERLNVFERSEYDPNLIDSSEYMASVLSPPPPTGACLNIDFEQMNFSGWATDTGYASGLPNPLCIFPYTPNIGTFKFNSRIQAYNTPLYDPIVGGSALPMIYPGSGSWSAKLEDFNNGFGLSGIKKTFVVDPAQPWVVYRYAVVLEDPGGHPDDDRPFFEVKITTGLGGSISCAYYKVIAKPDPGIENFAHVEGTTFYWRDWTSVLVPLDDYIGQTVTLQFTVGDCAQGGHLGYAYIDGDCLDGNLLINNVCVPEKMITAPLGFDHYHWTGEEIDGDNYRNELKVSKAGMYEVLLTTVTGCTSTRSATVTGDCPKVTINCTLSGITRNTSSCNAIDNTFSVSGQVTVGGLSDGYLLVKAGAYSQIFKGPFTGPVVYNITGLPANGKPGNVEFFFYKTKHFSAYTLSCQSQIAYTAPVSCATVNFTCTNCIKGFQPDTNKKYVVSAWVKQDAASPLVYTYPDPFIKLTFSTGFSTTQQTFTASGEIIDGWQRISAEFLIPSTTINVSIQLGTSSGTANFDDLRIYPADGTFKTFVYDPVTLRLTAELDENNYASFYEYDEEGALVRIKKETERGVMTIQENKNYKVKKP